MDIDKATKIVKKALFNEWYRNESQNLVGISKMVYVGDDESEIIKSIVEDKIKLECYCNDIVDASLDKNAYYLLGCKEYKEWLILFKINHIKKWNFLPIYDVRRSCEGRL